MGTKELKLTALIVARSIQHNVHLLLDMTVIFFLVKATAENVEVKMNRTLVLSSKKDSLCIYRITLLVCCLYLCWQHESIITRQRLFWMDSSKKNLLVLKHPAIFFPRVPSTLSALFVVWYTELAAPPSKLSAVYRNGVTFFFNAFFQNYCRALIPKNRSLPGWGRRSLAALICLQEVLTLSQGTFCLSGSLLLTSFFYRGLRVSEIYFCRQWLNCETLK